MNNWANKYVDRVNAKEERYLLRKKKRITKELNVIIRRLRRKLGKYSKEVKYIENIIIPYVGRMAHYPDSYRSMVDGFEELIKWGKRVDRRIW